MFEEVSNCGLAFGLYGLLVQMDLDIRCTILFGLFDVKDTTLLSEDTEDGIRSSDVSLHPFLMLDVVVLKSSHSSEDEVEPTEVDNVPAFLLGELWQKSSLNVLEERQVESYTVGFALFVERCDLAEDTAPGLIGLVEGRDFLAVERGKEVWLFVEQAT